MHTKRIFGVILAMLSVCIAGGAGHAQGFGHSAAVSVSKRLGRVKNPNSLFDKPRYLRSGFIRPYARTFRPPLSNLSGSNLSAPNLSASNLSARVTRTAESVQSYYKSLAEQLTLTPKIPKGQESLFLSTFQARPSDEIGNFVSGSVFKTEQGEIYGVIPVHGLSFSSTHIYADMIQRHFTADVFDPVSQKFISLPAEVVQISPSALLDMALVKFKPQDEVMLHPLSLSISMPTWNTPLSSQGFASRKAVHIPQRRVTKIEPFVIQTDMLFPRESRAGLCGGPVTDSTGQFLWGVHDGSSFVAEDEKYDKGYVTPAWVLERLVQAYKNGGKAPVSIVVDGKKLLELNVDEYISQVLLRDSSEFQTGYYSVEHKFSYQTFKQLLEEHYARYIDFTVHRVRWNETGEFVEDSRFSEFAPPTIYRYDTETGQFSELLNPPPDISLSAPNKTNLLSRFFKRKSSFSSGKSIRRFFSRR